MAPRGCRTLERAEMLDAIVRHFRDGGSGMYPILALFCIALALVAERTIFLLTQPIDYDSLLDAVERCVRGNAITLAARLCEREGSRISEIVRSAVLCSGEPPARVAAAIDVATLRIVPELRARTHALLAVAQIALAFGLLGTINGLTLGFACVGDPVCGPTSDPGCRASLLAGAIGEAMNCTAFGLFTAIFALAGHAFVRGRSLAIENGLDAAAARIYLVVTQAMEARR